MTEQLVGSVPAYDIILRAVVGSTALGLNQEGNNDRDETAVCIENIEQVIGFSPFTHYIYRTAAKREHDPNAKSQPGDLDLTIYGLRRYLHLCLSGNPSLLMLLFVPPESLVRYDARGGQLQGLAPYLISKRACNAFLGYLTQQRERLVGDRGQKDVHRPDLVEKYGFDTKYAMHMLRLGIQGVELMQTGRLTLPMPEPERSWLQGVRVGKVSLQECLRRAEDLEQQLKDLRTTSKLRDTPDKDAVESWMIRTYFYNWKAREPRVNLRSFMVID